MHNPPECDQAVCAESFVATSPQAVLYRQSRDSFGAKRSLRSDIASIRFGKCGRECVVYVFEVTLLTQQHE